MTKWQGHLIIAVLLMILAQFYTNFWAWWYVIFSIAFVVWGVLSFTKEVGLTIEKAMEDDD